jgi:hypothetical protein
VRQDVVVSLLLLLLVVVVVVVLLLLVVVVGVVVKQQCRVMAVQLAMSGEGRCDSAVAAPAAGGSALVKAWSKLSSLGCS